MQPKNNFTLPRYSGKRELLAGTIVLLTLIPLVSWASPVAGLLEGAAEFSWASLLMSLLGGLALFLYGMDQMAAGLKSAAGDRMKQILSRFTSNRVKAALTGGLVTALIQSSSVTTVLVVGFVSAGLMTLSQSVGVIMGANVGTTLTAQIVAFKVEEAALAFIAAGFAMVFLGKRDLIRQSGNVLMGLGLIFFGMSVMSDGMSPLRSFEPFVEFMLTLRNPFLGILVGALFTALVQSSSATTGIVIALASQGLIELPAGISLILGANIGTCFTAMLATLGKSREAVRVAMIHVLFNVFGVLIWTGLIPFLAAWVQAFSPSAPELEGPARLAAEVPRQIANAHALFNISNTLLLLPFTTWLARLVQYLVPDKVEIPVTRAKYLEKGALTVPSLALHNVRLEAAHMGEFVHDMLGKVPRALASIDRRVLIEIAREDDVIDHLQGEILEYASKIRKLDLSDKESVEFRKLMVTIDALERIGDVISNDIVAICQRKLDANLRSSETLNEMLTGLHAILLSSLNETLEVIRTADRDKAIRIAENKTEISRRIADVFHHQELRFHEVESNRIPLFRIEMDLVEKQRRIFDLIQRIAQQV